MIWQHAWVWITAGLVLAALEMVLPGFYLLGLAVGALFVGLLVWAGVLGASLPIMVLVAAVAAALAWWMMRSLVGVRKGQTRYWDRDINEN